MNSGRLIGIILLVIGFIVAVIAGLWLATQVNNGQLETGGALIGALLAFIPVGLLVGTGIYLYARGGAEAEQESEMELQRRLMDIVRSRGEVRVPDVAIELGLSVERIKNMVHQLVGLQVFSGYINWEKGTLYSAEASKLRDLQTCKNCGGDIKLTGKGVVACPFCGTEYFLS
ncbi:MAG TPA: hypothetical protein PLQ56_26285 [Aggregatilineales bacterium]|nr:hypothetical protein [Aggregatilineales bacterium]